MSFKWCLKNYDILINAKDESDYLTNGLILAIKLHEQSGKTFEESFAATSLCGQEVIKL